MRCLYCANRIDKYNFYSLFIEKDLLCLECRKKLEINKRDFKINDLKITYFYDYDSFFKTLLIQYKECNDEALKDLFLYRIKDYLKAKYHDYEILYVPSTKKKINERGFNHLKLIFESLNLKEVEGLSLKEEISQLNKNSSERKKMLKNYIYNGTYHKKVLIVDDVYTTGSSILGTYMAIKDYCGKVEAVVLAKVR